MDICRGILFTLLLFVFFSQSVQAASDSRDYSHIDTLLTMNLEQLVNVEFSLATGTSKSLKFAPAVATVITSEDIKQIGAVTLDESLQTVAGLTVMPSHFNRLNSTYSIRGIHTGQNPHVLRMVDGIPIRDLVSGSWPNTFSISTANIKRIEVIKSPGSALYGADAFAGTINIITKKADDLNGITGGARAGSFGYTDTWLQYGNTYKGWDVAFYFDLMRNDGDNSRIVDKDLQTDLDAIMGTSASYAPGPLETDDQIHEIQLRLENDNWNFRFWKWGQKDGGEGAGSAQILDPEGNEDIAIYLADLIYDRPDILPALDLNFSYSYQYQKQENHLVIFPPGAALPIGSDGNVDFADPAGVTFFTDGYIGIPGAEVYVSTIDMSLTYTGLNDNHLLFGGGYHHSSIYPVERKNFGPGVLDNQPPPTIQDGNLTDVSDTQYIFMNDKNRTNWHILLQDEWSFAEHMELTAGIRYDNYSDFGSTVNPRLALVWESRFDLITKLLYGRAFRAPTFGELYFLNNPISLGNENLKPEIIDTVELVFNYKATTNLYTSVSFYGYEIDGLIDYVADPGQTSNTAQNAFDQEGYGVELEADWLINDSLRSRGNFSYQHSEIKNTGEPVPFAPEMTLYLNLNWTFLPEWSLDGQYFWMAGRERAENDPRENIKNNDIVNLTLRKSNIFLFHNWEAALAIRNLFDEDVREPSTYAIPNDYPMEERSFWAELSFHF